jgi:ATP-binding cassette subfamily C protein
VIRRNYFCGQKINLLCYGLTPVIATADFPQETFLKAAAVVSEVPWASGPWPTARSNKGGVGSSTSSAGKTTLADILISLTEPDEGDVLLDGVPLQEIDLNSWRQLIGYVSQEPVLFYDSIYANIALGATSITENDVQHALDLDGAIGFIISQPLGIMTIVGQQGAKLPGGQRQRIAIARALVTRPKLLILDEVTSALDPAAEIALCEKIREFSDETTVFAITYRPALVDIADRVIQINKGQAAEQIPQHKAP